MIKKIAVLGAGNAGTALSGHLALKGFQVRLYEAPQFKENLDSITKYGGVELTGAVEGFGQIEMTSTNMEDTVCGSDLILIAVPAFAHEFMMREYMKYARKGQ